MKELSYALDTEARREDCWAEMVSASCDGVVGRSRFRAKDREAALGVRGRSVVPAEA